jgi:nucleotide-binding universal stress UspA family protein
MFKRILVALDGTPDSEAVLPHVATLVNGTRAAVTIVTVSPEPRAEQHTRVVAGEVDTSIGQFSNMPLQERHVVTEGETVDQAVLRAADEGGAYLAERARLIGDGGTDVTYRVLVGDDSVEEIARFATEGGYDLIALGTQPKEGISRLFSRDVADQIMERTGLPALVFHTRDGVAERP